MEYTMQAQINRGLLKYAVQTAIFCPGCKRILDMRRAVYFEIARKPDVRCGACYDHVDPRIKAQLFGEVLDGRELYRANPYACTGPRKNAVHAKDVQVGKRYEIHHTSGWVVVKVLRFQERYMYSHEPSSSRRTHYVCLNEKTGREIVVKSAAKFQKEVM